MRVYHFSVENRLDHVITYRLEFQIEITPNLEIYFDFQKKRNRLWKELNLLHCSSFTSIWSNFPSEECEFQYEPNIHYYQYSFLWNRKFGFPYNCWDSWDED